MRNFLRLIAIGITFFALYQGFSHSDWHSPAPWFFLSAIIFSLSFARSIKSKPGSFSGSSFYGSSGSSDCSSDGGGGDGGC